MKLYFSATSPYVRKVLIIARETGQEGALELVSTAASPVTRDKSVVAVNPTGKIPALVCEDGTVLYDSRVICRYIDSLHGGMTVYPEAGPALFDTLRREALADGLLDAALLARYEIAMRPAEKQWPEWLQGQLDKIDSSLDQMQREVEENVFLDAGWIACACALGYLDFRFADRTWRTSRPELAAWFAAVSQRPSMKATVPPG